VYQATVEGLNAHEGCQIEGEVKIHKVPGNFHISSHDFGEAYQKLYYTNHQIPMQHKINHLSFGNKTEAKAIYSNFGESMKNELSGTKVDSAPYPMG
jgi:hypothetical protein